MDVYNTEGLRAQLSQEDASERIIRMSSGVYLLNESFVLEAANVTLYAADSSSVVLSPSSGWSSSDGHYLFDVRAGGMLEVHGIHVMGSRSTLTGGAFVLKPGGAALLSRCTISDFHSNSQPGGAVAAYSAQLSISEVTIKDCATASNGGALFLRASQVSVRDSSIEGCEARDGGAIFVSGDSGYGPVWLANCTLSACTASERGGLLYAAGDVTMSNRTVLEGGVAGQEGSSVYVDNADVKYQLPGPAGHWLPNARCVVFRETYGTACADGDSQCEKDRDECAVLPDDCEGDVCTPPVTGNGETCTAATFVQYCDWQADPSSLGQYLYQLPTAPIESHFPYPCAPGIRGSAEIAYQSNRMCAGECPAGTQCPFDATVEPLACDAGSFCKEGTIVPQPCPDGTYSSLSNLTQASECSECPVGFYCVAGGTSPEPCHAGYYGDAAGLSTATCTGQCDAGYYCEAGSKLATATACPPGTYNRYAGGDSELSCLTCPLGYFCPNGTAHPLECPEGTMARAAGVGIEMITQCTCQVTPRTLDSHCHPSLWAHTLAVDTRPLRPAAAAPTRPPHPCRLASTWPTAPRTRWTGPARSAPRVAQTAPRRSP